MNQSEQKLIECAKSFGITDKLELVHLLAQCSHESANFTKLVESFNYSPKGLMATWGSRFNTQLANELGRTSQHPAKQREIANVAYNGRMGNAINSNDGYDYRGRGYIQCTGKDNYIKFDVWLKSNTHIVNNVVSNPALLSDNLDLAALSAIWFWLTNNIGEHARMGNVMSVSKLINCGNIKVPDTQIKGLEERLELTEKYKKLLGV